MLHIRRASLLELPIAGPRPNGPFVLFDVNVDEARSADVLGHGVDGVELAACFPGAVHYGWTPGPEDVVCWETAVVALDDGACFYLFDPASWADFTEVPMSAVSGESGRGECTRSIACRRQSILMH